MAKKTESKKKGNEDDTSLADLTKNYGHKCTENGKIGRLLSFKKQLENENQDPLEIIHLYKENDSEQCGPVGIRAIMDALCEVKNPPDDDGKEQPKGYNWTKKLKIWRLDAQDEGVRCVCRFVTLTKKVEVLDLLANNIKELGCEFLAGILKPFPSPCVPLLKLKLDHNEIGDEGLQRLCTGLSINNTLERLSLNYCGITEEGSKYLQCILANIDTKLEKLKVSGNKLRNNGIYQLFKALDINETLLKISVADNQFDLTEDKLGIIDKIVEVMEHRKNLGSYDFQYNTMHEDDAQKLLDIIEGNKYIWDLKVPECYPKSEDIVSKINIIEKIKKVLLKRKKPKNKKKKKGKKKKK